MHIYYKQVPHNVVFLYKIKEHLIKTLYNLLNEDLKILHFLIYLLTLYIKRINTQLMTQLQFIHP